MIWKSDRHCAVLLTLIINCCGSRIVSKMEKIIMEREERIIAVTRPSP